MELQLLSTGLVVIYDTGHLIADEKLNLQKNKKTFQ